MEEESFFRLPVYISKLSYTSLPSSVTMSQLDNVHSTVEGPTNLEQPKPSPANGVKDAPLEKSSDFSEKIKPEESSENKNGFTSNNNNAEKAEGSEASPSLEHRLAYSQQILQLIEENNQQLNELMRRNEEKREVINDLSDRLEKLMAENQALQEENFKLMVENRALANKQTKEGKRLPFFSRHSSFSSKQKKPMSMLQSLTLSPRGRGSPSSSTSSLSPFQGAGSPSSYAACFSPFRGGSSSSRSSTSSWN